MEFTELELFGVYLIKPRVFGDDRGFFKETYKKELFAENGIDVEFVQDNDSFSQKGVLRGMHYQLPPFTQDKLVKVIQGKVLDVVIDLRKDSPTFGKHVAVELSAENHTMLFVPKGFAHGFVTLTDQVYFQYKVSNSYNPESERGVRWNDPALGIDWKVSDPQLVERDEQWPLLANIPESELF